MSISRQNLTIVIVTLKSEKVIHQCIKSIDTNIPIIVVENSNDIKFKEDLESKYKNLKCVLSKSNIGMGAGNNVGMKLAKTDYVLILNPDVILRNEALNEIFLASKKLNEFSILSPISSDEKFPNYGMFNKKSNIENKNYPFKVDYVDGFAMLLNKIKLKEEIYFDENFFMYLENNDLCLRTRKKGGLIYVIPGAKIEHGGAKGVNPKYKEEVELSRNWHWVWSKYYFNKKNYGTFKALQECFLGFVGSIFKFLFFFIIRKDFKRKIYFNRVSGFYNAFIGKSSWYRPDLQD